MAIPLPDLVETLLDGPHPLPIVTAGDPVLCTPAALYDGQLTDTQLDRLTLAMRETMHAAPGVGLAAPRVGIPLRLAATGAGALGFDLPDAYCVESERPVVIQVLPVPVLSDSCYWCRIGCKL